MSASTGDNPGWTPDIAKSLIVEMNKLYGIERDLRDVLRDSVLVQYELVTALREVRDELRANRKTSTVTGDQTT